MESSDIKEEVQQRINSEDANQTFTEKLRNRLNEQERADDGTFGSGSSGESGGEDEESVDKEELTDEQEEIAFDAGQEVGEEIAATTQGGSVQMDEVEDAVEDEISSIEEVAGEGEEKAKSVALDEAVGLLESIGILVEQGG